jgi:nucleotide-binding universal stress UspA family protein
MIAKTLQFRETVNPSRPCKRGGVWCGWGLGRGGSLDAGGGECRRGGLPWQAQAGAGGVRIYNSAVADAEGGAFELGTDGPMVILVGVDDSVTAMRAGAYAAGLARRQGARLVCVYVERPSAMYGAAAGAGAGAIAAQEQALEETAEYLRRQAEEGAKQLGVPLTFVVAHGDPYTQLRRVADEVRADAVIVGASAQAGHRWIGSLAVRLVKAGRWPVTVVP